MKENEDKLLMKYIEIFGDFPPLIMTLSYNHPIYQSLMKEAINKKEPITAKRLDEEFEKKKIKYDMD